MSPVLSGPTVSTQWVADHLGSDDLIILDATVIVVPAASGAPALVPGRDRYLVDGHLPGAAFADLVTVFGDRGSGPPFTKPDAAAFERAAASVGVRDSSTVVVYDSAGGAWSSRVWWMFRRYGFESVAVLEGGLSAWLTEGRDTDTGWVTPQPGSIVARPQPVGVPDKADVERVAAAGTTGRARKAELIVTRGRPSGVTPRSAPGR